MTKQDRLWKILGPLFGTTATRHFLGEDRRSDGALLADIRARVYTRHSDADLRSALAAVTAHDGHDGVLPVVYAIVGEAVDRRLGAWRVLADDAGLDPFDECRRRAADIVDAAPYRAQVDYYTDEDFLDGPSFAAGLQPLLDRMRLDPDESAVVAGMVYVAEKSKVSYGSQILLPAEFYRAVAALDSQRELAFRVTDEQLLAALMLYRGVVVEMNAGEGKTVTAAFPAIMHALAGRQVHVITANDYLAARDAEWLAPVYESLSITAGAVLGHMGDEDKRTAYRARIAYGTVRELGFDFLRDNLRLSADELVQRRHDVAIVDEADQTLIDEARTPLIISGGPGANMRGVRRANEAVRRLVGRQAELVEGIATELRRPAVSAGRRRELLARLSVADPENPEVVRHLAADRRLRNQVRTDVASSEADDEIKSGLYYLVDLRRETVTLSEAGHELIEQHLGPLADMSELDARLHRVENGTGGAPLDRRRREAEALRRQISRRGNLANQVHQLLRAHMLLRRDVDYIVTDGEVVLVDPVTGRRRPDSKYQHGLHAAIEAKEGLPSQPEPEVQAQISVQGYVALYRHLSGMTGTALAAADEFRRFYRLSVEAVPPTTRSVRTDHPARVFADRPDKVAALLDEVRHWHRMGRPVLVGTVAVDESVQISALLRQHGIEHTVLNAVTSASEAAIVRAAGDSCAVTVATNMAGRGTDILLEPSLDLRIAAKCADLVCEAFASGAPEVVLWCSTPEEAAIAEAALDAVGLTTWRRDRPLEVVARPPGAPARPGLPVVFEFGLGLHVIGTELNESRRSDDQLRGRVGRQGAFGSTRFLASLGDRSRFMKPGGRSSDRSERRTGASGLRYLEGPRTQRRIDESQRLVEREDELDRVASWELDNVVERQTLAYYALRRRVLEAETDPVMSIDLARMLARRLVDRHLPESAIACYATRFPRLAEELQLDYQVDLWPSFGLGIEALRTAVGGLIAARVRHVRAGCRLTDFAKLERLLLVQTADELWPDHLARLHDMMLSVHLPSYPPERAAAEYAFAAADGYSRFLEAAADGLIIRLVAYREADVQEQHELTEELQEILV